MDHFVQSVGTGGGTSPSGVPCQAKQVMDYYDGNTVTGLWNYAQQYAMSDDSFGTTFGPSAPGAVNLASGDTGNVDTSHSANSPSLSTPTSPDGDLTANGKGGYSLTSDAQPYWDDCSTRDAVALSGTNIGDELNRAGVSWGWFEGGFKPSTSYQQGLAAIGQSGQSDATFIPDEFAKAGLNVERPALEQPEPVRLRAPGWRRPRRHRPVGLQGRLHPPPRAVPVLRLDGQPPPPVGPDRLRWPGHGSLGWARSAATRSPTSTGCRSSTPPTTTTTPATSTSWWRRSRPATCRRRRCPGVSFLKAPGYQDGHAGYSDPADEQQFITGVVNALMKSPDWSSTAVIVNYDDSDGWYDHVFSGVTNPSSSPADNLTNTTFSGADLRHVRKLELRRAGRRAGPLRLRSAAADDGDLAVREVQLRRSQPV